LLSVPPNPFLFSPLFVFLFPDIWSQLRVRFSEMISVFNFVTDFSTKLKNLLPLPVRGFSVCC
jgi:hypothetical protein